MPESAELIQIEDVEAGVVIYLFLSYRATSSWQEMVTLVDKMSPHRSGLPRLSRTCRSAHVSPGVVITRAKGCSQHKSSDGQEAPPGRYNIGGHPGELP